MPKPKIRNQSSKHMKKHSWIERLRMFKLGIGWWTSLETMHEPSPSHHLKHINIEKMTPTCETSETLKINSILIPCSLSVDPVLQVQGVKSLHITSQYMYGNRILDRRRSRRRWNILDEYLCTAEVLVASILLS